MSNWKASLIVSLISIFFSACIIIFLLVNNPFFDNPMPLQGDTQDYSFDFFPFFLIYFFIIVLLSTFIFLKRLKRKKKLWLGDLNSDQLGFYLYFSYIRYRLSRKKYQGGIL